MNSSLSSHSPASSAGSLPASLSASDTTFSVMLKGIRQDVSLSDATAQLASLFKLSPEQAASLLALPSYTVKKSLPHSTAIHYQRAIEAAGGVCDILPDSAPALSIDITLPAPAPVADIQTTTTVQAAVPAKPENALLSIAELKENIHTKTLHFVLLTIATFEIYPLLWLTQHHAAFNRITRARTIDMTFIIWMAVCLGLGGGLIGGRNETINLLAFLLFLAARVLEIIWAFRAKEALQNYVLNEYKVELKMSPVRTFAFSVFYINYCINDLPDVLRRQQILRGQTPA